MTAAATNEAVNPALEIARRLERAGATLRDAEDGELRALGAGIAALLRGETGLTATFGLAPGQSEHRSSTLLADDRRDGRLREIAQRFFAGHAPAERPGLLADELNKFDRRVWPRLKGKQTCPPRYRDSLEGALWEFFHSGGCALGVDRIREIIGES